MMVEVEGLGMKVCDISPIKIVTFLGSFIQFPLTNGISANPGIIRAWYELQLMCAE